MSEWYPFKNLGNMVLKSEEKNQKETIGEWFTRMGKLEKKLSSKQLSYLIKDPYYQVVIEAVNWQMDQSGEKMHDWLNFPMVDSFGSFRYWVKSENVYITIKPEKIENLIKFWSETENVALAELAIQKLNKEITHRTVYGARGELAPADGHVLSWSNAAVRWIVFGRKWRKGEELLPQSYGMDANQIFAPYKLEFLRNIAHLLDPLSLYKGSIEAKSRGHVKWEEANTFWTTQQKIRLKEEKEKEKHR